MTRICESSTIVTPAINVAKLMRLMNVQLALESSYACCVTSAHTTASALLQPIHDVVRGLACNVGKHDITSRAHKHTPHHSMPLTAGSLDSTSTTSDVISGGAVILICSIRTVLSRKLRGQPRDGGAASWCFANPTYIPGPRAPSDLATKYAVVSGR